MAQTQAPAKRDQTVKTVAQYFENYKGQIKAALPRHMTPDRMTRIALTEIRRNPKLQDCTPISLFASIIVASQLGLEPGLQDECYLIPYKGEAQCQPGYKGLAKLAKNTGEVKKISAHVVYENDEYDVQLGSEEFIHHRPNITGNRGDMLFVYAVAFYQDGTVQIEPMTKEEVEHIRDNYSKPYINYKKGYTQDPPAWVTSPAEMWRKTAIIRLCKRLDLSPEKADSLNQAIHIDHQAETGEGQDAVAQVLGDEMSGQGTEVSSADHGDTLEEFERLAADAAKTKQHREKLDRFVQITADHQGVEPDEIKKQAASRWEQFWSAFERWKKQNGGQQEGQGQQQESSTEQTTSQDPGEATGSAQPTPSTIECPDNGHVVSVQFCQETCSKREGCPEWQ